MRPFFLLCNDDGVHAPGVKALRDAVRSFADCIVVAPHVERSATSQSISIATPLRMEIVEDGSVYAVEGTPADCVLLALQTILDRKPDWILSGINRGGNLGLDTLYSGTVGAALEGAIQGYRAMAVSVQGSRPLRYDTAGQVVKMLLEHGDEFDLTGSRILNVNVPSISFDQIKGIKFAKLGRRLYEDQMRHGVDPRGRPYYWVGGGGEKFADIPGSDCVYLDQGFVTVSVLHVDLCDHSRTGELQSRLGDRISAKFRK